MQRLSAKERLARQALGQDVDCIPTLGGWIGGAKVLAALAGMELGDYLADPFAATIRAYKMLDVDGMIEPIYPTRADQIRSHAVVEEQFAGVEPEALRDYANSLPDSEAEVLRGFDAAANEARLRDYFTSARQGWQGIEPIANFWDIGGHFPLYSQFGYVAFLSACALYPESVQKIWWARALHSRQRARILVRLYREFDLVPLMFCGEDLANNQGPMVSPEFLRRHYFPTVRLSIEPLLEAGVRLIHHCDGDVRPLIDDFLALGFSGLQGFQYELGVHPYDLKPKRDFAGRPLLYFASLSVSRTLPFGSPEDVRREVDWWFELTDGGRGMFLFTTNVTGPEVPPENLLAGYHRAHELQWGTPTCAGRRPWPYSLLASAAEGP
jgi:hypothetical protein